LIFGPDQEPAADFDLAIAALQHDVLEGAGLAGTTANDEKQPKPTHGLTGRLDVKEMKAARPMAKRGYLYRTRRRAATEAKRTAKAAEV